jgi:trehalose 6-phosphate phosphatase
VVPTTAKDGSVGTLLAPLREDPGSTAIFCDVDGTLAPIVERPGEAGVPADARGTLAALADRYELVGCISGRRATEARELVGVDGLAYIGNHGFERLLPGQSEAQLDHALHAHADAAARFVEHHLDPKGVEAAGLRLEDKGPIAALHWRGAPDEVAAEAKAREIARDAVGWNLVPHWGRKVLEIRPAVELNKGTALAQLLEERRLSNALYGGDDRTDVDAFRKLRAMGATGDLRAAICVGVASAEGPRELIQEADLVVEDTAGFLAALRLLLD